MVSLLKKKLKPFRKQNGAIEKRKNVRVPFSVESKVKFGDKMYNGTVLNLSFRGMLLEIRETVPVNSMLDVKMIISSGKAKREVILPGKVIRSDKKGAALRLLDLNRDSVIDLKEILLQNYIDHDQIVSEFSNYIQKKACSHAKPEDYIF